MKKTLLITIAATLVSASAAPPRLLPFQGRLTDASGNAVPDGAKVVQFKIYDAPTGGTAVWNGEIQKVTANGGLVSTLLGSKADLSGVDFNQALYLEITVDATGEGDITAADPPLLPRQSILPSVFAVEADTARNANKLKATDGTFHDWSALFGTQNPSTGTIAVNRVSIPPNSISGASLVPDSVGSAAIGTSAVTVSELANDAVTSAKILNGEVKTDDLDNTSVTLAKLVSAVAEALVPVGTILPYGGTTAPTGYLLCDGSSRSTTGVYAGLFAVISTNYGAPSASTFNVPDLRGQFLRGVIPNLLATCTGSASSNNVTTTAAHPFNRTGMRVKVSGTNRGGLALNTTYYVINVGASSLAFAATQADAISTTPAKVALSGSVAGMVVTQGEDPDAAARTEMAIGGTGVGNLVGSMQPDALKSHSHRLGNTTPGVVGSGASGGDVGWNRFAPISGAGLFDSGTIGGNETRPINAYVNYIIKY